MIVLAVAMALGVFLVAGAAAREVRVAELKSNFVASVSHDLKTPLALIQLFAETLELGRVRTPERAQEYYRIINGEVEEADAPDREHSRLLAHGSGPAPVSHGAGRPVGVGEQGAGAHGNAVLAGQLRRHAEDRRRTCRASSPTKAPPNRRSKTCSPTR